MTPAQSTALLVALDGLKHEGVDPADVVRALYDTATAARMLRAEDGRIEEERARFRAMLSQAMDFIDFDVVDAEFGEATNEIWAEDHPFSPAETPQGASTHRPDHDHLGAECWCSFPVRCGAQHFNFGAPNPTEVRCDLGAGHGGDCQFTHPGTPSALPPAHGTKGPGDEAP